MSIKSTRETLVKQIIADWDHSTSFPIHVHDWFDPDNPFHYGLVSEARGQWFRPDDPIPYRVFRRWADGLGIELPESTIVHRGAEKRELISHLLRDWDRSEAFATHARDWQDLSDPFKYQLIQSAMGQRFRVAAIPHTTIQQWIRQLNIEVPVSRRTKTPSRRTLFRWKKQNHASRHQLADRGPRPLDTS